MLRARKAEPGRLSSEKLVGRSAITEAQRRMEDLQAGQELAKSWSAYLEAILRPCRWIDGVGILAACETMHVRVVIMRWRK
eukprot:14106236-Alexandrium_andersonii.AAC.1